MSKVEREGRLAGAGGEMNRECAQKEAADCAGHFQTLETKGLARPAQSPYFLALLNPTTEEWLSG